MSALRTVYMRAVHEHDSAPLSDTTDGPNLQDTHTQHMLHNVLSVLTYDPVLVLWQVSIGIASRNVG